MRKFEKPILQCEPYLFVRLNGELKKPLLVEVAGVLVLELPDKEGKGADKKLEKQLLKELHKKRLKELHPEVFFHLALIRRLKLKPKEYPDWLVQRWHQSLPEFDTLIFVDNEACQVKDYLYEMTRKAAAVHVFSTDENLAAYQQLAEDFFFNEGIVLQIHGWEDRQCSCVFKGKAGVVDFGGNWYEVSKRLPPDITRFSLEDFVWQDFLQWKP